MSRAARLGEPDGQQLTLIVPVVERLTGRQPLVALQTHQRCIQHRRKGFRRRGLTDARLAFQQQRPAEGDRQIERGRGADVEQIVLRVEAPDHIVDIGKRRARFVHCATDASSRW